MYKSGAFWMVRAGRKSYLIEDFLEKNIVAIGWNELGDIRELESLEAIKDKYIELEPHAKKGKIDTNSSQVYKFYAEIAVKDRVITYDTSTRLYHIGKVKSDYEFDEEGISYYHYREVEWLFTVKRDVLTVKTKNSLAGLSAFYATARSSVCSRYRIRCFNFPT